MATSPLHPPHRHFPLRSERRRGNRSAASTGAPSLRLLVEQVIEAVNARGLCAAEVARIADLPKSEIASMATQCRCPGCWRARAN